MRTIVLDTNCLLAVLPSISPYHQVWNDILTGEICLCVSNEVLEEYEEILGNKTNTEIAKAVVCAVCGNAELLVTNDAHFDILRPLNFPR